MDGGDSWDEINNGLHNHIVDYLKVDGDTLMAVTTNMGLFSSSDEGNIWSKHTIGTRDWGANVVSGMYIGDGYKLASTFTGLYRTHSLTKEWVPVVLPDGNKPTGVLAGDNDRVVTTVYKEGVYTSLNGGEDWTFKPVGLFLRTSTTCAAVKGDTIIIGAIEGIFISKDFGDTWEEGTLPPGFFFPYSIVLDGSSWFVVAGQGIFRSVDREETWARIDDLPLGFGPEDMVIDENGTYFIGTQSGVYISYNKGVNWYPMNAGLRTPVTSLVFQNDRLVCGTYGKSLWAIPVNQLNALPLIVEQKNEIIITNEENITLTLGDFEVKDPDNELLILIVGEGENYTAAGNVIAPVAGFVGDLTVPVRVDDGVHQSDVFNATVRVVSVVGTTEFVQGLKVYPNPASDRIYIEHQNQIEFPILLMDMLGRVMLKENASYVNGFSIDLSPFAAGVYLLKIRMSTETRVVRISKK